MRVLQSASASRRMPRALWRYTTPVSFPTQQHSTTQSSSSTTDRVRTEFSADGRIAHVVLNRPDKRNALDLPMFHALRDAGLALQSNSNSSVRVIILRGQGKAFCTGLDVPSIVQNHPIASTKALMDRGPRPAAQEEEEEEEANKNDNNRNNNNTPPFSDAALAASSATTNLAQEVAYLWRQFPVPVIAVLHGMCFGGGLQIALGADLRLATPDCQLSIMESKWGLIPDMSATVTLRELLRIDVAKELTWTGRRVSGTEAQALGLVTRCEEDPWEAAETLAQQMVQTSPDSLRLAKELYQTTWSSGVSEEYCLTLEHEYQRKLLLTWNQMAASGRNFGWKLPYFTRR